MRVRIAFNPMTNSFPKRGAAYPHDLQESCTTLPLQARLAEVRAQFYKRRPGLSESEPGSTRGDEMVQEEVARARDAELFKVARSPLSASFIFCILSRGFRPEVRLYRPYLLFSKFVQCSRLLLGLGMKLDMGLKEIFDERLDFQYQCRECHLKMIMTLFFSLSFSQTEFWTTNPCMSLILFVV
jgi:hypothetical protein